MAEGRFRFDGYLLDADDRRLMRDGEPVELNARYFDALALLVAEAGRLVSKERFLEEVWRGVPVTDEALTQCIRTLRRQLGDEAARPRFIETAPKHGYRFIAPVERLDGATDPSPSRTEPTPQAWRGFLRLGLAATAGGAAAGGIGGLIYGVLAQPTGPGMGGASIVAVLVCLTVLVGLLGGAGVGFGIAAAGFLNARQALWSTVGGFVGGMLIGAMAKLLGLDAFDLLFGQTPGPITGAGEGALLGGAVGLAAWAAGRLSPRRALACAGLLGALAGAVIPLLGGRLMGGSLDLLVQRFPHSRLRIAELGRLFGEPDFGRMTQVATGAVEGLLFSVFLVGAILLAARRDRA